MEIGQEAVEFSLSQCERANAREILDNAKLQLKTEGIKLTNPLPLESLQ